MKRVQVGEIEDKATSLAEYVQLALQEQGLTITTAESCTGGVIASMLTRVAGSSTSFHAGFVTYSNEMKSSMLNVPESILRKYGAVSQETVIEMAKGALEKSSSNIAIAVSGVAGPDGGTEEKPVGTVWIAWGTVNNLQAQCLYMPLNRDYFQKYVASISLDLVRRELINSKQTPNYIIERAFKRKTRYLRD